MKVLSINHSLNSSIVELNKSVKKEQNEAISSKNLTELFVFSCNNEKFAIRMTNIDSIKNNYSEIFHTVALNNQIIYGFCFYNNELIKIVDINYLLNISISNNKKILIEILRGNFKYGILIDNNSYYNELIDIKYNNKDQNKYRHIENIIRVENETIYLINETTLFSEISKNFYSNEHKSVYKY